MALARPRRSPPYSEAWLELSVLVWDLHLASMGGKSIDIVKLLLNRGLGMLCVEGQMLHGIIMGQVLAVGF